MQYARLTTIPDPAAIRNWKPTHCDVGLSARRRERRPNPTMEIIQPTTFTARYLFITLTMIPQKSAKGAMTSAVGRVCTLDRSGDASRDA